MIGAIVIYCIVYSNCLNVGLTKSFIQGTWRYSCIYDLVYFNFIQSILVDDKI